MVLEELPMILVGVLNNYLSGSYVRCWYLFGVLKEVLKALEENRVFEFA